MLQLIVKGLVSLGNTVTIFTIHYPFTPIEYSWHDCKVIPLNGKNSRLKKNVSLFNKLKSKFKVENEKNGFDIIHSFWLNESTYFGCRLSKEFSIPVVSNAMGQDVLPDNLYLKKIKKFDLPLICLSTIQMDLLTKCGFKNHVKIGHGVESVQKFEKVTDLIIVGNLIKLKNVDYFIDICKELKKKRTNLSAKIVGDGKLLHRLKEKAENLNLKIEFTNQLNHSEAIKEIAKAKVLVHCSSFEGFGMVLTEALAASTHVISTNVGFAAECDEILELSMSVENDADTINSLLNSPQPEAILYSIKDTVNRYAEMYQKLI